MTESWAIQISPRVGDTLINLRAETGEQMLAILEWYQNNSASIASALGAGAAGATVGQAFAGPGTQNVQPPAEQSSWSQQGSQQQAAPQGGPGPAPQCPHGPMQYRESKPGAAKAWKAWMCPSRDRANQCDPQWLR